MTSRSDDLKNSIQTTFDSVSNLKDKIDELINVQQELLDQSKARSPAVETLVSKIIESKNKKHRNRYASDISTIFGNDIETMNTHRKHVHDLSKSFVDPIYEALNNFESKLADMCKECKQSVTDMKNEEKKILNRLKQASIDFDCEKRVSKSPRKQPLRLTSEA